MSNCKLILPRRQTLTYAFNLCCGKKDKSITKILHEEYKQSGFIIVYFEFDSDVTHLNNTIIRFYQHGPKIMVPRIKKTNWNTLVT